MFTHPSDPTMTPQLSLSRDILADWRAQALSARPFLRWAGGKQPFLARYGEMFPFFEGKYLEPFLGGASVFLHLVRRSRRPFDSILGDTNRDLIRTYEGVRDSVEEVSRRLGSLAREFIATEDKPSLYYTIRDRLNGSRPRVDPADFIFINRTCWNGLYRVSRHGKFNVPYGAPRAGIQFPDLDTLSAASAALVSTALRATSWENIVSLAEKGDFVFLDPPYVSDIISAERKYSTRAFSVRDHRRLADALRMLATRGVSFFLTNSAEPMAREIYEHPELSTHTLSVTRSINSKTELRGSVSELLVVPRWYTLHDTARQ